MLISLLEGFLTGDLEDRVILDLMDVLGRPQGSYPENFVSSFFWLRYKDVTKRDKKVTDEETDRQTDRQTLFKYNIDE